MIKKKLSVNILEQLKDNSLRRKVTHYDEIPTIFNYKCLQLT